MLTIQHTSAERPLRASRDSLQALQGRKNSIIGHIARGVQNSSLVIRIVSEHLHNYASQRNIPFSVHQGINEDLQIKFPNISQDQEIQLEGRDIICTFADVCKTYTEYLRLIEQELYPAQRRRRSVRNRDIRTDHGANVHRIPRTSNEKRGRNWRRKRP